MKIYQYSLEKYPFKKLISNHFGVDTLEMLHLKYAEHVSDMAKINWEQESSTFFHKSFYARLNENGPFSWKEIVDTYNSFVRDVVKSQLNLGDDYIKQKFPSFRVQLPNAKAINKWHYDADKDHRHPDGEINIQIPLTVMYDSSATWIESIPGLKDFAPMEMFPGQFAIFYGNKCMHGNKTNETGLTRVSLDFRIINKAVLKEQETKLQSSATINTKFAEGGYYEEI